MTSKLALYNDCLLILGEEKLASLSETGTRKNALDDAYDTALAFVLEQGFWNFAMRVVQVDSSPSVTPSFGYSFAFARPTDWVRTFVVSSTEVLVPPLLDYADEAGYWYANSDPIYVKYVSNSASYGADLSLWSAGFANYVATRLAVKTCKRITASAASEDLLKDEKRALAQARSKDAMDGPPGFPPAGSWATSRTAGQTRAQRRDNSPISN